jgi:DNA polymerase-1
LKYKKATKLKQFCEGLPKYDVSGRIHARLSPDTDTGRLACKDPNLQQIPKSDPYGIRSAFCARPGYVFCIADFSQMEMVVLAHICISLFGEHQLATALESEDFHARTAQLCWPEASLADPKRYRKYAKAVNYGINYGKSAGGLAAGIGVTKSAAEQILSDYYAAFPEVALYRDFMQNQAKRYGWVPLLDGRRRLLPNARLANNVTRDDDYLRALKNKALRQALNTPIQGSAAAIVNKSMGRVWESRKLHTLGAYPVLQIHDELILEAPEEAAEEALRELEFCMVDAVPLKCPLKVDGRIARTWLATEE